MDTPIWDFKATQNVYEPAEDSFLLLDALEADLASIRERNPTVVVEVGSGSGVIVTALAKALNHSAHCLAVDISSDACLATQLTATLNSSKVDVVQGDLLMCLKGTGVVDLLVFNPPYVVTTDEEISGTLQRAWAGGTNGRVVIDRFLNQIDSVLSAKALFYLVVIKENNPEEIINLLKKKGLDGKEVAFRKIQGEQLSVLRFSR